MESKSKKPDHEITILVNGQEKIIDKGEITYDQVIILAFGSYDSNPDIAYTILYFKGHSDNVKGQLIRGASVKVVPNMVFNVTRTNKS
jgi:hypothetical protein